MLVADRMKFFLALLAGASLAALPVAFAGAQDPVPQPCGSDVFQTDPKGDQVIGPVLGGPPLIADPGPDNMDIRRVFFTTRDGKTSANIQITKLDKTVPETISTPQFSWYIYFDPTEEGYEGIRAETDGTAVKFTAVKRAVVGVLITRSEEAITGKLFEGPDGVVQIDLPAALAKPGRTLEGVYAAVTTRSASNNYSGYINDEAPDGADLDGSTKKLVVPAECTGGGDQTTTTTETTETGPPTGAPPAPAQQPQQLQQQPQPQPTQTSPPAPGQPLPATGKLKVDVAIDKGKRKTARKRGLRGRIRCSVQCKVKATATISKKVARKLKLGRKTFKIGKGKASIKKAGRIKFYVKLNKKAKRALKRKGVKKFALKVSFRITDNQGKQLKKVTKKSTLR